MLARPHQEPRGAKLFKIITLAEVLRIMAVVEGFEPLYKVETDGLQTVCIYTSTHRTDKTLVLPGSATTDKHPPEPSHCNL